MHTMVYICTVSKKTPPTTPDTRETHTKAYNQLKLECFTSFTVRYSLQ